MLGSAWAFDMLRSIGLPVLRYVDDLLYVAVPGAAANVARKPLEASVDALGWVVELRKTVGPVDPMVILCLGVSCPGDGLISARASES